MSRENQNSHKSRNNRQNRKMDRQQREQEKRRERRNNLVFFGGLALVIVLAIVGVSWLINQNQKASATGASPNFPAVDGVSCDQLEQTAFHIHAHVSIYINGQAQAVPSQVGINPDPTTGCFYWLHTHDTSGIIHMEAPVDHAFVFGNFLDIWEQHFNSLGYPAALNQKYGWTVYVNGKLYTGDYRKIPMKAHTLITMGYNSPGIKPDTSYNWNGL